jgi:hypothetical protein
MVIVNYRYKEKYTKYISLYIKIKIIEILKYDLSCTGYCIVIAIYRFILTFWTIK